MFQNESGNCVAPGLGKFPKSRPRVKRECVPRSARAELSALISLFLPRPIIVRNQWRSNLENRMTQTRIGIANPEIIDLFGVDQKTGEVLLVMNEPRPWDGSHQQLHEMQEKFNAYASFILDGEMTEAHPELAGRIARIQLRCEYMPGKEALALLQAIHDHLELQAIRVEVVVADRSCDDQCGCQPEPIGETSQLMIAYT